MSDHYIDNEVPAFGEWDSQVEAGSSTIVQSADASFPERGNVGLRCSTTAGNAAYVQKDNWCDAIAPGGSIFVGQYYRVNTVPTSYTQIMSLKFATHVGLKAYCDADPDILVNVVDDAGANQGVTPFRLSTDRWYWMVWELIRAATNVSSDGGARLYVDGVMVSSLLNVDNYDRLDARAGHPLQIGCVGAERDNYVADSDEVIVATSYPEPYVPTPETAYPESRRTVVLFRQGNSDSREFADYCVDQLGVPRCNLCPLPNATANESLASYATFQTEVETDLAAWLALNPTVATNCSTFLIGYGVPGYFTSGGVKHSATSRLMNYGTAFSSQTTNPLYNPATIARLTKTDLGGKYLCTRIDADSLAHAKTILDNGLSIAALPYLPDSDKLYSDESTYLASLNCQHLRIQTHGLATPYTDDAFIWANTGTPSFGTTGSRVVFCDDSFYSADTLRATSEIFDAIITNGYAAGLGNSTAISVSFDIDSFFEMLRIGGTLVEALAVSIANLDYTSVGVGSPLMTVAFLLGGYNVYQGQARADQIDYEQPVAYLRPGVAQANLVDLGLAEDTDWYFGCRAVSSKGVEEENTTVTTRVRIESGALIGPPPNAIASASVVAIAAGSLSLSFRYNARGEAATATAVQVALVTGGVADWSSPLDTISISGTCRKSAELGPFDHGSTVQLALRAVTAGGVGGEEYHLDPVVADSVGPGAVDYLIAAQEEA